MTRDAQTIADATPRFEPPAFNEPYPYDDFDWDEIQTCEMCAHCFKLTDRECKAVTRHMNPYGRWHKHEGEVYNAMRHALKCFGVCEVEGELVELTNPPCDHWEPQDDH